MAQHDYSIANQTFPNTRQDLNNSLSAIVSNNSGATEPTTTYAYQWWYDETTDTLKIRNSDNDAWITMFTFDQTADTYSLATDVELTITENLDLTGSATISGDLTVDTNTLYVDSSNNRVGIATTSPQAELEVSGTNTASLRLNGNPSNTADAVLGQIEQFNRDTSADQPGVVANILFKSFSGSGAGGYMTFGTHDTSEGGEGSAPVERMKIDGNGNVGIGTSSPGYKLDVNGTSNFSGNSNWTSSSELLWNSGDVAITNSGTNLLFKTYSGSALEERMRIQDNGAVKIGTPAPSSDLPGLGNNDEGVCFRGADIEQFFINSNNTPCFFGKTADGSIVAFQSAGTQEGSINISGATVSYNGFTGTHWSRLVDNSKPTILKGTILESLDEMMDWYNLQFDITKEDGSTYSQRVPHILQDGQSVGDTVAHTYEGTDYQATIVKEADIKHTKSKISDTVDAKNVYGVFVDWDNDDDTINDMYVAQTGTFVIRINGSETVSKGDLIQSNGDGTGKVQSDDIIRASTVAKVISSTKIETYDDGSYIVPCTLHC